MRLPGFVDGTYNRLSNVVGIERTVNLFPERIEQNGMNQAALAGTVGSALWATVGAGPIRFMDSIGFDIGADHWFYVVSGDELYRVETDGSSSVLVDTIAVGTGANDDAPIIVHGTLTQTHCLLVSGGKAYSIEKATDTVTEIATFTGKTMRCAVVVDTYFFTSDGINVYYSSPGDCTTWSLLSFFVPTAEPDGVLFLGSKNGQLWIFKSYSTEVYYNNGDATNPFQRVPGIALTFGIGGSAKTVVRFNGAWFFMGITTYDHGGGIIYKVTNYEPKRISNRAFEEFVIDHLTDLEGIHAFAYQLEGRWFYVFQFPTADATWVYDDSMDRWHEWASYDAETGLFHKHFANCVSVQSDWIVGSDTDGTIHKIGFDLYTDGATPIMRMRQVPHLHNEGKVITYDDVQLLMEVGAAGATETVSLSYSNDGGKTFSTPDPRLIGSGGGAANRTRVLWRRKGSARDRVFRFTSTAEIQHTWVDVFINNLSEQ